MTHNTKKRENDRDDRRRTPLCTLRTFLQGNVEETGKNLHMQRSESCDQTYVSTYGNFTYSTHSCQKADTGM